MPPISGTELPQTPGETDCQTAHVLPGTVGAGLGRGKHLVDTGMDQVKERLHNS